MATGSGSVSRRLLTSSSSQIRLTAATSFLLDIPSGQEALIVAASRGAADDLARDAARRRGASFGWHRFSLLQLAARLAMAELARRGRSPSSPLGAEAVAARAIFDVIENGELTYFSPVVRTPGFPRALARTLGELRLAGVPSHALEALAPAGADLAHLLERVERQFADAGAADRARLLDTAAAALTDAPRDMAAFAIRRPLVLLDLSLTSIAEEQFVSALAASAPSILATVPLRDDRSSDALVRALGTAVEHVSEASGEPLARLRTWLFASDVPSIEEASEDIEFFSAPGEGREAVEIARRVLTEARRGVPFDEMAVLVRTPHQYLGLLEHAFGRAGVPAWFERGTRRPDPAGRAFLAMLLCAEEDLSARRFAEYLSLAQVPDANDIAAATVWVEPDDEVLAAGLAVVDEATAPADGPRTSAEPALPIVDGTLRAPWRWESLLVESAVIGGRDRWEQRLRGLDQELRQRLREVSTDEPDAARAAAIARDLEQLGHLSTFAVPIIAELDAWRSAQDTWGVWLARLEAFAPRVLRRQTRVLRVLAELRPMSAIGPVGIGEVRKVLTERLRTLAVEPPSRRFGRVFIGSPDQARGRAFRVVFVPGLAERLFPQKLREDPLLLDDARARLDAHLRDTRERGDLERLQLRLAVGAATERLYLSYPRMELADSRPRVPSFYALDLKRAVTGRIPSHDELEREAFERGDATLAWPAPSDATRAIDVFEHDLATLRPLVSERDPSRVVGRARYMLELNACLGRSVRERWARHQKQWSDADGVVRVTDPIREALGQQRLGARPYSLSALQQYSACPYRFLLSAIYRLAPREDASPLQRLDPLTKGSLFHRMQAEFLRALRDERRLPIPMSDLPAAVTSLLAVVQRVAEDERAKLAPPIRRVWDDEIGLLTRDLRRWVELMAADTDGWIPEWFELAFGLAAGAGRDEASRPDPVRIDGRFVLRGSMDLVERHGPTGALRVTDHKTGRARVADHPLVSGGEVLQPILYSLALEEMTGKIVHEGRLWFCTGVGEFKIVPVQLTETSRRAGLEVLEIIDRGIELGLLAAYPKKDACQWCDFRSVCGPNAERRARGKHAAKFMDLIDLRGRE
jgi:ATP-dependent helicase/nuclease subunit B